VAPLMGASGGGGTQVRALTINGPWNGTGTEWALSEAVVAKLAANRPQLRALAVHGWRLQAMPISVSTLRVLAALPGLERLELRGCHLGPEWTAALADALKAPTWRWAPST